MAGLLEIINDYVNSPLPTLLPSAQELGLSDSWPGMLLWTYAIPTGCTFIIMLWSVQVLYKR